MFDSLVFEAHEVGETSRQNIDEDVDCHLTWSSLVFVGDNLIGYVYL